MTYFDSDCSHCLFVAVCGTFCKWYCENKYFLEINKHNPSHKEKKQMIISDETFDTE